MTATQIQQYANELQAQANAALDAHYRRMDRETEISNRAREQLERQNQAITQQFNEATTSETKRWHLATEAETASYNAQILTETQRSNKAQEALKKEQNRLQGISLQIEQSRVDEIARANRANEALATRQQNEVERQNRLTRQHEANVLRFQQEQERNLQAYRATQALLQGEQNRLTAWRDSATAIHNRRMEEIQKSYNDAVTRNQNMSRSQAWTIQQQLNALDQMRIRDNERYQSQSLQIEQRRVAAEEQFKRAQEAVQRANQSELVRHNRETERVAVQNANRQSSQHLWNVQYQTQMLDLERLRLRTQSSGNWLNALGRLGQSAIIKFSM